MKSSEILNATVAVILHPFTTAHIHITHVILPYFTNVLKLIGVIFFNNQISIVVGSVGAPVSEHFKLLDS